MAAVFLKAGPARINADQVSSFQVIEQTTGVWKIRTNSGTFLNGQWATQGEAEEAVDRLLRPYDAADLM